MRIQYFSDLHLEFYHLAKFYKLLDHIKPVAPICVLAGDIGHPFQATYKLFLTNMSKKFEHVILIHGNHEYYSQNYSMATIQEKTKQIISENMLSNVHFLHTTHREETHNSYIDIDGYRFVGSTMWTHISDPKHLINDANQIPEFSVSNNNNMHAESKQQIKLACMNSQNPTIVITHHLPLLSLLDPKYAKYSLINQCFASDCSDLVVKPVKAWIYGHTHSVSDVIYNNVRFVANPIGYQGENKVIDFEKIIELP